MIEICLYKLGPMKIRDACYTFDFDIDAFMRKSHLSVSTSTAPSHVYVLSCSKFVKVGMASNVAARIADLQVACPLELKLVTSRRFEGLRYSLMCEKATHEMLQTYSHHGEWFRCSPKTAITALDVATRATNVLKRKHDAIKRRPVNDNVMAHVFPYSPMARKA